MDTILKGSLSAFFIIFFTFIGIGLVNVSLTGRNADDFASMSVNAIESSNYSQEVIDACKAKAEEDGFSMIVTPGGRDKSGLMRAGTLSVTYDVKMPLVGVSTTRAVVKALR